MSSGTRVRPWVALALPPLAWYSFELGLGSTLRPHCAAVGSWLGLAWGICALLVCATGIVIARPMARAGADPRTPPRPWLARIAMLGAGIFMLAIAFQTLATQIVPPCVR